MKHLIWSGLFGLLFMLSFVIGRKFQSVDLSGNLLKKNIEHKISPIKKKEVQNTELEIVRSRQKENIVEEFRDSNMYEDVKKELGKDLSPYVYDFIALSNLNEPETFDELEPQIEALFLKNVRKNPEKLFSSIVKGIEGLNHSPVDQAHLMAHLTKIPGMEEKAKEVILNNLQNKVTPVEMKITDIKSFEDENKFFGPRPDEVAFDIKFKALISISKDPEEDQSITMNLFKKQKNSNIQRNIASTYLKKNPGKTNTFVDDIGINKANKLLPANIDIEDNGNGEYTFIKLIEPKNNEELEKVDEN